jgi:hypothetical protein
MHAPYDRSGKSGYRGKPKEGLGFLLLPTIVAFVLITLIVVYPKSSVWISKAVEAEFGAGGSAADMPVRTAEPGMTIPMRTVDAY